MSGGEEEEELQYTRSSSGCSGNKEEARNPAPHKFRLTSFVGCALSPSLISGGFRIQRESEREREREKAELASVCRILLR
jgi:hypothetical protein